jgi:hypothetical protein
MQLEFSVIDFLIFHLGKLDIVGSLLLIFHFMTVILVSQGDFESLVFKPFLHQ